MTIPLWCLLAGIVLPYIWAGVSVPFRNRQLGGVDLQQPRVQGGQLSDSGAGAVGAQMNQWEALSVFTAASFIAYVQGVDPTGNWALASIIWVAARVLHGTFYVLGQAALRVLSFVTGLAMSLWIVVMGIIA